MDRGPRVGWLTSNIAAALLRWTIGLILTATCLAFGFAPEEFIAEWIGRPPAWVINPWTRLLIVCTGVGIFLLVFFFDRRTRVRQSNVAALPTQGSRLDEPKLPMPDISATTGFREILTHGLWVSELRTAEHAIATTAIEKKLDQQIHDYLSLGRLTAWGRPSIAGKAGLGPLVEIPRNGLEKFEIVFNERSLGGDSTTWRGGIGNTPFFEVHFSRDQLFALFPLESSTGSEQRRNKPEIARDVTVNEAVAFMYFGEWGRDFFEAMGKGKSDELLRVYELFMQAAADGKISMWGRREHRSVYEPIPKEFWYDNRITWLSLMQKNATDSESTRRDSTDQYLSLMTSRAQVERQWPIPPVHAK